MSKTHNNNVVCGKCGTGYSRPRAAVERKSNYRNCPNCAEAGNVYWPVEHSFKKEEKKLSNLELLQLAAKELEVEFED